jgi:hypothetical protein
MSLGQVGLLHVPGSGWPVRLACYMSLRQVGLLHVPASGWPPGSGWPHVVLLARGHPSSPSHASPAGHGDRPIRAAVSTHEVRLDGRLLLGGAQLDNGTLSPSTPTMQRSHRP